MGRINDEESDFHDRIHGNVFEDQTYDMFFPGLRYAQEYCPNVGCLIYTNSNQILNLKAFEELCQEYDGIFKKYL